MRKRSRSADELADAVADDKRIDWNDAGSTEVSADERDLIEQFKIIKSMAGGTSRTVARHGPVSSPATWRHVGRAASATVVALAAAKAIVAAVAGLAASALPDAVSAAAVNVVVFGTAGALLVVSGSHDARLRALGALFLFIAAAFGDPVSRGAGSGAIAWCGAALRAAPPEAFFAAAFWRFAWIFPREPARRSDRLVGRAFLTLAAALGTLLFAANVALAAGRAARLPPDSLRALALFDRHAPMLAFWPLLLGTALPAIPYLLWRTRFEAIADKRRTSWFVAGFVGGLAPMFVIVVATPFVPALAAPENRQLIGVFLYAALASIIPTTVYAVVVRRVMNAQLIVQRTIQYALARYAVWLGSIGPIVYLIVQVYRHRDRTVVDVLRGHWAELLLLPACGIALLIFRQPLLARVDRWFQRETGDPAEALARLDRAFRAARSVREVTGLLTQEVDRTIHPKSLTTLLVDDEASLLVAVSGGAPPLPIDSALIELLRSSRSTIQIGPPGGGPLADLLPPSDREWLADGGFQLLAPLVGSTGALLGMVAIEESRSELPYGRKDVMAVDAMSAHTAMRLENQRLLELPQAATGDPWRAHQGPVAWQNEPGVCCTRCSRVLAVRTPVCPCGGEVVAAALPLLVNGKFRLERLIGSGGMGVVYLAVDIALDRRVAIKTLPTLMSERAARLQQEARTMASVVHPNLALIFGVDNWRQTPLLIVEYLDGGTLAERLQQGPLPVADVVELGVVLADVLDRIHLSGILHRDVKPSNIGFTHDGLPKLLDFGLAAMFGASLGNDLDADTAAGREALDRLDASASSTAFARTRHLIGTPLYLAPEAIAGETPRASFDVWSLTLVLYQAVAGQLPFADRSTPDVLELIPGLEFPDIRRYRADCPAIVASFFHTALSPIPTQRPQSAGELRNQLQRIRSELRHTAR